jgi:hypothetical protein
MDSQITQNKKHSRKNISAVNFKPYETGQGFPEKLTLSDSKCEIELVMEYQH